MISNGGLIPFEGGDDPNWIFYNQGNTNNIPQIPNEEVITAAIDGSMKGNATKQTKDDEGALIIAAQIARQNALIKSNILKKNKNGFGKGQRNRDITFEAYLKMIENRELEALKLNVDVLTADYRNAEMQEAQRQIDRQVTVNERWGLPLVR